MAWELCWYRYEVDLSEARGAVTLAGQGYELAELAEHEQIRRTPPPMRPGCSVSSNPGCATDVKANSVLVLHVDGGARGNPGPAAIGVVISAPDGSVVEEVAETIGVATNNVAEYRALLRGIERAAALGASEVQVINDSELVARQVTGVYKVKHPAMQPLHAQALEALRGFTTWSIKSVPRAQNAGADALVNQALDAAGQRVVLAW